MLEGGIFGLIRELYPVSTIMIVLCLVGGTMAYIPRIIRIRSLEKQMGIRKTKVEK